MILMCKRLHVLNFRVWKFAIPLHSLCFLAAVGLAVAWDPGGVGWGVRNPLNISVRRDDFFIGSASAN